VIKRLTRGNAQIYRWNYYGMNAATLPTGGSGWQEQYWIVLYHRIAYIAKTGLAEIRLLGEFCYLYFSG
jgi:hypothetical protein